MVFCLQTSSTVTRKYFHLFTVAAFIPGIYFDVELVFLAAAGTFFIAILLEVRNVCGPLMYNVRSHDQSFLNKDSF